MIKRSRHGSSQWRCVESPLAAFLALISFLACGSVHAAGAQVGVGLRVVNETAPAGGLAVIFIELTEPKPLSSGRVRFAYSGGPLLQVVAVTLLDGTGQVQTHVISTNQGAVVEFTSSTATFGTDPDVPIMAVAVAVSNAAPPGQTIPLNLDLSDSFFLDPNGQPYPEEVQQGVFTVGGVSISGMTPSRGTVAAGGTIRFDGVGFQDGLDVRIDGATVGQTLLLGPGSVEVTLGSSFQISPVTRIRLRNPDDSADLFYPGVVSSPGGGNGVPTVLDDPVSTPEDTPVVIDVLANDSDPDGDPLSIQSVTQPQHGSSSITASQRIRYVPDEDFFGADQFTYLATDGRGGNAAGTVRVVVSAVNDAPRAVADLYQTAPDQPIAITPLDNDSDVEGDSLSLLQFGSAARGLVFRTEPGRLLYFPEPLFSGEDRFDYQVGDGRGGVATATVTVMVRQPNLPPVAVDDSALGVAGEVLNVPALDNDSDPNQTPLTVALVTQPSNGSVEPLAGGTLAYHPNPGFTGPDQFSYTVEDASGMSAAAVVVVAVNSTDPPIHFQGDPLELVAGSSADIVATVTEPADTERQFEFFSTNPNVLRAPGTVTVPPGADTVRFRVFAIGTGTAVLGSDEGGFAGLPAVVRTGELFDIPAQDFGTGNSLGLAFANRSGQSAEVRLRAVAAAPAAEDSNSSLVLGPYQQSSRSINEYNPDLSSFRGWIEASSFGSEISAMFLNFSSRLQGLAGSSTTARASSFILHCAGLAGSEGFSYSLINNNPDDALVDLTWRGAGEPRTVSISLRPQEVFAGGLSDTFASEPFDGCPGSLEVESSQPLAAYQQVSTTDRLFGQRPPSDDEASQRLYMPQFTFGEDWFTKVSLTNLRDTAAVIGFTFRAPGVTLFGATSLAGRTTEIVSADQIFSADPDQLLVGSVEIETPGGVVGSAVLGRENQSPIAASAPLFPAPSPVAVFPQAASGVFQGVDFFTGLAIQNPNATESFAVIDVFSMDGEFRGWGWVRLGPGERLSKLLDELVPDLGTLSGGSVRIRSTQPLVTLEMFGDRQVNFLATVVPAAQ